MKEIGALREERCGASIREEMAGELLKVAEEVKLGMGSHLSGRIYANALAVALSGKGYSVERDADILVFYRGKVVGSYPVSLRVGDELVVLIKTSESIEPEELGKLQSILNASSFNTAFLINFKKDRIEYRSISKE